MSDPCPYVSRGGLKLRHALDAFGVDVRGLECADLGCSTGGFTHCLLQAGAARVHAVDTAYGQLAWSLRKDPRVCVLERSNALHAQPPAPVDLVVLDLGWTPQRLAIPAALQWLKPGMGSRIISLIKPHYEGSDRAPRGGGRGDRGVLPEGQAQAITDSVVASLPALGVDVLGLTRSPILGGAGGRTKSSAAGNIEWLVLLKRA